jgi:peptidoglycan hydrolase FlgJ
MDIKRIGVIGQTTPASLHEVLSQSDELLRRKSVHTVRQAAQEFEAYFLSYLLKTMRETVPTGFLDRKGEAMWYSFYDQEIARLATEAGGIGLTQFIEGHMPGK